MSIVIMHTYTYIHVYVQCMSQLNYSHWERIKSNLMDIIDPNVHYSQWEQACLMGNQYSTPDGKRASGAYSTSDANLC